MKKRIRFSAFALVIVVLVALFRPIFPVVVDGGSMDPTYRTSELMLATGIVGSPQRGQVVVFQREGETYIKRIAFLAGDSFPQVEVVGNWITPLSDRFLSAARRSHHPERSFVIPQGQVYVVGDSEMASIDSRVFGPLPISDLKGTVLDQRLPTTGPTFPGAKFFQRGGWAEQFFSRPGVSPVRMKPRGNFLGRTPNKEVIAKEERIKRLARA